MARRILRRRAFLRRPRTPCELAAALKGTPPYRGRAEGWESVETIERWTHRSVDKMVLLST